MSTNNKNGFCKHNVILIYCDICYPIYQDEQIEKWFFNLIENNKAVKDSKKAHDLYESICGNSIEIEQFH